MAKLDPERVWKATQSTIHYKSKKGAKGQITIKWKSDGKGAHTELDTGDLSNEYAMLLLTSACYQLAKIMDERLKDIMGTKLEPLKKGGYRKTCPECKSRRIERMKTPVSSKLVPMICLECGNSNFEGYIT